MERWWKITLLKRPGGKPERLSLIDAAFLMSSHLCLFTGVMKPDLLTQIQKHELSPSSTGSERHYDRLSLSGCEGNENKCDVNRVPSRYVNDDGRCLTIGSHGGVRGEGGKGKRPSVRAPPNIFLYLSCHSRSWFSIITTGFTFSDAVLYNYNHVFPKNNPFIHI